MAIPPKGGRASLLEVAAGAVSGLSRACSGEMQVLEREFARPAMELIKVAGSKGENQRYAGVLVLRALAENAPAVVYDRRGAFFETIWLVVNDLTVREGVERGGRGGSGGEGGACIGRVSLACKAAC